MGIGFGGGKGVPIGQTRLTRSRKRDDRGRDGVGFPFDPSLRPAT